MGERHRVGRGRGTTTVVCFAWQPKGCSLAAVAADYRIKAQKARVDYSFHLTVTDPTPEVLEVELPQLIAEGCRSVKVFMTYDGVRLDDRQVLRCWQPRAAIRRWSVSMQRTTTSSPG